MSDVQWRVIANWSPELLAAAGVTLQVSATSFVVAMVVGTVTGVIRSRRSRLSLPLTAYVEFFRGTPLLVQLFFIYYGLPQVGITMSAWVAAVAGLGLNGGAYISEIVRGALSGIERGQYDAAHALGFGWLQTIAWVVMPQALRTATPPLMNSFAILLKESSLVSILAITEMMNVANQIYSRTFRAFEIFLVIALGYFMMTFAVAQLSAALERRLSLGR